MMDTKQLYAGSRSLNRDAALAYLDAQLEDPRAYLIREFGWSFDRVARLANPLQSVLDALNERHSPALQTEKTLTGLMGELQMTREEVTALAISLLDNFYVHLNEKFSAETLDEYGGRTVLHEMMRFAAYRFEAAYELWSMVSADDVRAVENNIVNRLSKSATSVWFSALHLELDRDFVNRESAQIAAWLFKTFTA